MPLSLWSPHGFVHPICTLGTPGGLKHCPRPGPTRSGPGAIGLGVAWASRLFKSTLGILTTAGKPALLPSRAFHAVWGSQSLARRRCAGGRE